MGWRNVSLPEIAVYATASTDLLIRAAAELLGFGHTVGLLVPTVVVGRLALGLNTVGWALGWVLLWLILFFYAPLFFPRQGEPNADWTLGAPNRLLVATAAVGVGVTFESWLAVFESMATTAASSPRRSTSLREPRSASSARRFSATSSSASCLRPRGPSRSSGTRPGRTRDLSRRTGTSSRWCFSGRFSRSWPCSFRCPSCW